MDLIEFQNWLLSGIILLLLTFGWWSARNWIQTITAKIDQLITAVQDQTMANIRQAGEISNLTKRVDTTDKRLEDHSNRIKHLEIKTGKWKSSE
ncbi:MAG: hypothetical protein Q8O72_10610 [Bacteroidales bacterium]|nr:hypothetical protein [Bacteroidales bacterium]